MRRLLNVQGGVWLLALPRRVGGPLGCMLARPDASAVDVLCGQLGGISVRAEGACVRLASCDALCWLGSTRAARPRRGWSGDSSCGSRRAQQEVRARASREQRVSGRSAPAWRCTRPRQTRRQCVRYYKVILVADHADARYSLHRNDVAEVRGVVATKAWRAGHL